MVHAYQLLGKHIIIDTASAAVHLTNPLAYEAILQYEKLDTPVLLDHLSTQFPEVSLKELESLLSEISSLKESGQLFTLDKVYKEIAATTKHRGIVKALCLHVANNCNLTCSYCFAGSGTGHFPNPLMSFETGKQALDFLVAHSGERTYLEVDFFGGEPLLNWEVVKQLVAYGRSIEKAQGKVFRFTLTTNGLLLNDEIIDYVNQEMETVVLSLDGRPEVHDYFRKTLNGTGSYDIVVAKFQKLVAQRTKGSYHIRGTFTKNNLDFLADILHIRSLGFTEISMEPVVCDPTSPYAITKADLPRIFKEYESLAQEMARRQNTEEAFRFYHYNLNIAGGPCVHKRLVGCGAGFEYLAVTPKGNLFPCHQFLGDQAYLLGDVWQGVSNIAPAKEMADLNVFSRPDCIDCWAKLYCGGGCAANAYHSSGNVSRIDAIGCAMFKKRLECATWLSLAHMT